MRTLEIAAASKTQAKTFIILNCFYAFGRLDRDLVEYLGSENIPVMAKIPRAVALAQAAAEGKSVAEYAPRSHAVPAFELLADDILAEKEKHND